MPHRNTLEPPLGRNESRGGVGISGTDMPTPSVFLGTANSCFQKCAAEPVGVQQISPNPFPVHTNLGLLLGPAAQLLASEVVRPELKAASAGDFFLQFPAYLRKLEMMGQAPLSDEAKLTLLEGSLNPAGRAELQRRQELSQVHRLPPLNSWICGTG